MTQVRVRLTRRSHLTARRLKVEHPRYQPLYAAAPEMHRQAMTAADDDEASEDRPDDPGETRALLALHGDEFINLWDDADTLGPPGN